MSQAALDLRTVFRACVVSAVREGEPLMGKLVEVTRNALTQEESSVRNIQQRNNLSDALNALKQHEAALLKAYPMALLEIFAEGPANAKGSPADASGMDFGELSLMDDSEVQDQVELARAQQLAAMPTEGVLSELNTLVSSAQGLRSVQPERNLRPEITSVHCSGLCLKQAPRLKCASFGCSTCRGLLDEVAGGEYQRMAKMLRDQGVQPVDTRCWALPAVRWADQATALPSLWPRVTVVAMPRATGIPADMVGFRVQQPRHGCAFRAGRAIPSSPPLAAEAESHSDRGHSAPDAGGAEPVQSRPVTRLLPQMIAQPASRWENAPLPCPAYLAIGILARQQFLRGRGRHGDMAQLERLVNRLADGRTAAPLSTWRAPVQLAPPIYGSFVAPTGIPGGGGRRGGNMMATLAQDARLLPHAARGKEAGGAAQTLVRLTLVSSRMQGHPARRLDG